MEKDKGTDNKDVFTSSLVTRGQLNATTTNATVTTTTTTATITTLNANANAADKNEDDGCEDCDGHKPIPRYDLPTRTQDG